MQSAFTRYIIPLFCCIIPAVRAQAPAADSGVETSPLRQELKLINAARAAAMRDDSVGAEAQILENAVGRLAAKPRSLLLAQRTAIVCGLLQNADEWERASHLAERAIRRLALLTEENDADRAERLYWEAWIEARVLDRKVRAIELLQAAEKLAPNDERITSLALTLVASVVEFGR
jgi:hypothetical protein